MSFQSLYGPSKMWFPGPQTQSQSLSFLPSTVPPPPTLTPRPSSSALPPVSFPSSHFLGVPLLGPHLSLSSLVFWSQPSKSPSFTPLNPTSQSTAPTFLPVSKTPLPFSCSNPRPFPPCTLQIPLRFPSPSSAFPHPSLQSHTCPFPSPLKLRLLPSPTLAQNPDSHTPPRPPPAP